MLENDLFNPNDQNKLKGTQCTLSDKKIRSWRAIAVVVVHVRQQTLEDISRKEVSYCL